MSFKYLARVCAFALLLAACAPTVTPSPAPTGSNAVSATEAKRPAAPIAAHFIGDARRWYTVSDPLFASSVAVQIAFDADPTAAAPTARIAPGGMERPLAPAAGTNTYATTLDLAGVAPGGYAVEIVERLASGEMVVTKHEFLVSEAEYVVWTLDFEGDAAADPEMANTAAIADGLGIPMTVMWNPRAWTSTQVSAAQADAMLAWTKQRAAKGDEVSLHLHMWTDFIRAAGLVPRTAPNWAGRADGYDVPISAYTEAETSTLLDYSLKLMADHGLSRPTTFRAGGQFASSANLRAVAAAGFVADASAVPAGGFGRLPLPWTLAADAQPYFPATDDANASGSLPLLEAPTIGGNTYAYTKTTIAPIVRADVAMIAREGQIARARRAITIVSHPGTIDATERAAIESLFAAFEPFRYDRDAGPVRFVTLAQLARAYAR